MTADNVTAGSPSKSGIRSSPLLLEIILTVLGRFMVSATCLNLVDWTDRFSWSGINSLLQLQVCNLYNVIDEEYGARRLDDEDVDILTFSLDISPLY